MGDGTGRSREVLAGRWSIASAGSVGSILSVNSVGSILSIGSSGSIASIGSAGCIASIGSAGSIASIGASGSIGSIGGAGRLGRWRLASIVGILALGAAGAATWYAVRTAKQRTGSPRGSEDRGSPATLPEWETTTSST